MNTYEKLMKKCIRLAKRAEGKTSPNPLVGCIITNSKGEIISEGYHKKYGEFHAERNALNKLNNAKDCTLIVNLEPCCHHGKTPPCTDIIIEKSVKKVIYGMKDPNPIVAGKGLEILKKAGIEVVGPVLEDECKNLNEKFIKNKTQNLPFVAIKTATTIDGKIATSTGNSKWITSEKARNEVYKLRKQYDAILTSSSTIIADNPTMNHQKKIILDRELKTDFENAQIYKQGEIFVFYDENIPLSRISKFRNAQFEIQPSPSSGEDNIRLIHCPTQDNKLNIDFILKKSFELGIMSIFVEAGGGVNNSFLPYSDKLYHFIAPKVLGDNNGKSCFYGETCDFISDCTNLKFESVKKFPPDILITYSK